MIDSAVPPRGWMLLDLERTLRNLHGLFGRPVLSLSGRIKLPGWALGGAPARPAPMPPCARDADPSAANERAAEAPASALAAPAQARREPVPPLDPQPRPPRRVPDADIVYVGRRSAKAGCGASVPRVGRERSMPDCRSAPVPKVRRQVRPWLAVVSALAMAGMSFYAGMQWARCHVINLPTTMGGKTAII